MTTSPFSVVFNYVASAANLQIGVSISAESLVDIFTNMKSLTLYH